jgi:hypothetical protein
LRHEASPFDLVMPMFYIATLHVVLNVMLSFSPKTMAEF